MIIKELKQALKYFDENDEIIVFYEIENEKGKTGMIEDVISICKNGPALQINCESVFESLNQ